MDPEEQVPGVGGGARKRGRPKLAGPRRVRITTTVEPSRLALLREHAQRMQRSLGQLADEYVQQHFVVAESSEDGGGDAEVIDLSRPRPLPLSDGS
jgi:hypothetical protein